MSLAQFERCLTGYKERLELNFEHQDRLNHILGKYMAFAFNSPKKYPSEPFLAKRTTDVLNRQMSDEEMNLRGRLIAQKYGRIIKNGHHTR